MKTVLCYGDSLTWGYIPGSGNRFPYEKRWPIITQRELGSEYRIIDEGLTGRYTVWDEPFRAGRNGAAMLPPLLDTHAPLDGVVVLLGTNDVLHSKVFLAPEVARGVEVLVEIIQRSNSGPNQQIPSVLLVAPPRIGNLSDDLKLVCSGDVSLAEHLGLHIRRVAEARGVHFLDATAVCEPSPVDGVHLDEANLQRLGCAIAAALESALRTQPAD